MDFEKEARELLDAVFGDYRDKDVQLVASELRRAYAAGQEDMKETAAYVIQAWCLPDLNAGRGQISARDDAIARAIRAIPTGQDPKVNEFAPLATAKDIGLE